MRNAKLLKCVLFDNIQYGDVEVEIDENKTAEIAITFPKKFKNLSAIITQPITTIPDKRMTGVISRSTNGFTLVVYNGSIKGAFGITWVAIGKF